MSMVGGPLATAILATLTLTTWAPGALGLVAFAPLFAALMRSSRRAAFAQGFLALTLVVTVSRSFVVDALILGGTSAPLAWCALLGLGALHGLIFGAAAALAVTLGRRGPAVALYAAALFTLAELAPRLPLAYPLGGALSGDLALARGAAVVGVTGLSLAAYGAGASLASLSSRARSHRALFAGPVLLLLLWGSGALVAQNPGGARVARVHLDAGGRAQGDAPTFPRGLEANVALAVLPESLFPEQLAASDVPALAHELAGPSHPALLFATTVRDTDAPSNTADDTSRGANRAHLVARDGSLLGANDKEVLVPLVEAPLVDALFSTQPRDGRLVVPLPEGGELPIAVTICYEALFSDVARARVTSSDAVLLVNLANDGWFDDARPIEAQVRATRLRAIELGVPALRVSNAGTSAAFLPDGATLALLGPAEDASIDVPVAPGRTPYRALGLAPAIVLTIGVALVALGERRAEKTA